MLSEAIVKEYHRINRVFPSHLVAFVAFEMLQKKYEKLDLFSLLRLSDDELVLPYQEFKTTFEHLRDEVVKMYQNNNVHVDPNLMGDADKVIAYGLKNVGMYHSKRTLMKNKAGNITTEDINTLFYYHNRLVGYDLEKYI